MSFRFNQFQEHATRIQPVKGGSDVALTARLPAEGVRQPHQPTGLMKYFPQTLIVVSAVLSVIWTAALFWFVFTLMSA